MALLALWLLIQLPLVYIGSYVGFVRVGAWEHPIKTNAIARQIPANSWNSKGRTIQTALLAGLIPFAVIFIELLFLFKNMWQDKTGFYYVFGFMAVVGFILMITIVEVTIVAVYMRLCSEVSCLVQAHFAAMTNWHPESPLAMVFFLRRRRQLCLGVCLLHLVLLHQTSHQWIHLRTAVLQLQLPCLYSIWHLDWYSGLLISICICEAHLRSHQSRLITTAAGLIATNTARRVGT